MLWRHGFGVFGWGSKLSANSRFRRLVELALFLLEGNFGEGRFWRFLKRPWILKSNFHLAHKPRFFFLGGALKNPSLVCIQLGLGAKIFNPLWYHLPRPYNQRQHHWMRWFFATETTPPTRWAKLTPLGQMWKMNEFESTQKAASAALKVDELCQCGEMMLFRKYETVGRVVWPPVRLFSRFWFSETFKQLQARWSLNGCRCECECEWSYWGG